jgi:hypothetical protein
MLSRSPVSPRTSTIVIAKRSNVRLAVGIGTSKANLMVFIVSNLRVSMIVR